MGEVRELSNGALYDMETHRIVANPGGGSTAITQASASAMAKARYEKAALRAADGMAAGVRAVQAVNPAVLDGITDDLITGDAHGDAWAILHAVTTAQVLQSDKPQPDALQAIGRNTRMIQPKEAQAEDGIHISARIDADQLMGLVQALRDERARRTAGDGPADADAHTAHTPTT